jgi:hypothetical protein
MPINLEAREKIERNFFSPLFVKLANLHYINEEYEDCIEVCRTGLAIYPDYVTAKLILLRAFLKAEYLNEAEGLFQELTAKITSQSLLIKLRNSIDSLASVSNQEKLYFPSSPSIKADFSEFEKNIEIQEKLFPEYDLNSFLEIEKGDDPTSLDPDYREFMKAYEEFHFYSRPANTDASHTGESFGRNIPLSEGDALLGKVRIITETLADLYATQGNYREAFEAYNLLLRAGSTNYKRIEEKLIDLERRMQQNDSI